MRRLGFVRNALCRCLTLALPGLLLPGFAGAAEMPEAFRNRIRSEPDNEAVDSIDFILSLALTQQQARAILPVCALACRRYGEHYLDKAEIQPREIEAYSAFLEEDRLDQGFTTEIERRTARIHRQAIEARESCARDVNALAVEVWDLLNPYQQQIAANYEPNKEAVFATFASPQEKRHAARRWRRAAKEKQKSSRRAAQRGQLPSGWRRPDDPRLTNARHELEVINRAVHPRPDNIARYLLTPAAAEPLYTWTGVRPPRDVRDAVQCWRFGVEEYPLDRCRRDEHTLHQLRKEINNWNLVNGMHFSAEQIEQLVHLVRQAERLKTTQRQAKPKDRMHPDDVRTAHARFEHAAEYVLRPGQREVLATYKPCLIPPKNLKDPVRVGQANDNTRLAGWLERTRSRNDAQIERMIDRLIDGEIAHLGPLDGASGKQRRAQLRDTVRRASEMSDVEFAINKDDLADAIQPRDRREELTAEIDTIRRARLQPGRTARLLLNRDFAAVLMMRYDQLRHGAQTSEVHVTQGAQAPDCDDDVAARRASKEQRQGREQP